jgi:hypothetical protein
VWPYSDGLTKLGTMMFFPLSPFSFSSSFVVTSISMESSVVVDGGKKKKKNDSISLMKFSVGF